MSAATPAIPRLDYTGRVTQARVILSEWTKLHSLRSTRWSLLAAVVLTIGLPAIFAAVTSSHWGSMSPHERADRHPLDIALAEELAVPLPTATVADEWLSRARDLGYERRDIAALYQALRYRA